ncbi:EF-P 5-aminopentanol modification-associated protein YfmF [Thermoflavimicrobium dichotomicum]|uniref:Predicted Zn-dependent peptidase n=1 Tax=Thermoflavimicrobium dichotomicum TaxID=46223 RepID=A0A1I3PSG0_9BACL|nr:pitrilysin family protein [Thermoflavimicrobium dichotomicum]SFJ24439.1 Predicted Zn-dependent peptidase [Thermoflavimicrobium dichotomicum]
MTYSQFETISMGNIRIHVYASKKFKTTTLSVMLQQQLSPDTVTKTALLPNVLQRGTASYPSTLELKRKLADLYGAILFGDVYKRGERHIMQFGLEIANEQYLQEKDSLLYAGLSFLCEVLTKPATENGVFVDAYVQQEKAILKQKIESLQDDKIRYAAQRSIEEMCKNEPYALFNHGRLEDLPGINPQNLYTYYQEVLKTCPMDVYIVGNVSADEIVQMLSQLLPTELVSAERESVHVSDVVHQVREVKVVVDRLDVKQGKLNMGCRTQISVKDPEYPALLMYNGILGGFPHSKLFINVREKASLAYYASSSVESHKGLLTIQSGIEIENYEKAVDIIKQQLEAMRAGQISENEIRQTKATISNQFREQQDRPYDLINFHFHSILSGVERTLPDLLQQIEQVQKEDILKVAEKVQLDTIYFLRDQGGNPDAKN